MIGEYVFPEQVIWSRKELKSLKDLQGQKIRVISSNKAEFIKRTGGSPVTLGTAEVPAALDRSVVDAAVTASSGYGYVWRDLSKYTNRAQRRRCQLAVAREQACLGPVVAVRAGHGQGHGPRDLRQNDESNGRRGPGPHFNLALQMTEIMPPKLTSRTPNRDQALIRRLGKNRGTRGIELLDKVRKALRR
ncbi:hypothetical protein [Bradyrhizobium sp. WSM2793]|uniref:hypothetical protein n=1 Tax=Bradyrhizobium sp. WSM2793 TaxID=1038866 RepID=UPI0012F73D28